MEKQGGYNNQGSNINKGEGNTNRVKSPRSSTKLNESKDESSLTLFPELIEVENVVERPQNVILSSKEAYEERSKIEARWSDKAKQIDLDSLSFDQKKRKEGLETLKKNLNKNHGLLKEIQEDIKKLCENNPEALLPEIDQTLNESLNCTRKEIQKSIQEHIQNYEKFQNDTYTPKLLDLIDKEKKEINISSELKPELESLQSNLETLVNSDPFPKLKTEHAVTSISSAPKEDPNYFSTKEPKYHPSDTSSHEQKPTNKPTPKAGELTKQPSYSASEEDKSDEEDTAQVGKPENVVDNGSQELYQQVDKALENVKEVSEEVQEGCTKVRDLTAKLCRLQELDMELPEVTPDDRGEMSSEDESDKAQWRLMKNKKNLLEETKKNGELEQTIAIQSNLGKVFKLFKQIRELTCKNHIKNSTCETGLTLKSYRSIQKITDQEERFGTHCQDKKDITKSVFPSAMPDPEEIKKEEDNLDIKSKLTQYFKNELYYYNKQYEKCQKDEKKKKFLQSYE